MSHVSKRQSVRERVRKVKGNMHSWKHRQKFQVWKKCTSSQDFILISARVMRDFHGSDSILLRILRETCGFKQTSRILRQERVNIWWASREINFTVTSESRRKTSRQHHPFLSLILSLSVNAPSDGGSTRNYQQHKLPANPTETQHCRPLRCIWIYQCA